MHYEIRGESANHQYLQIEAVFTTENDTLNIQFPRWRPGRYELGNFAKNVRAFQAFDSDGKTLVCYKTDTHVWRVVGITTRNITVKYEYYATELNAGSSYLNDDLLYVNPVNCLVYILGKENDPCSLQVHPKQRSKYAGTLPENAGLIQASSYHELVDSPFVFSTDLSSETYNCNDVQFRVSFIGLNKVPWSRVLHDFKLFTQSMMDDFGQFPTKHFHFINIITPYPHYHGVEHQASTMIVLGPNYKIFESYYDELLGISSHELYHVWNVKSIRSVDLWPYDYSQENLSKMGYLCEGITTYMGDYYLMKSGIWSLEKYLKEWEIVIQKHVDNFGRFNASLAESSFDTWLDGYVAGAPGKKTSIYNEGAIFAFITDVFIRTKTLGKKSLKNLMRDLYEHAYLNNKGVSELEFIETVERISGDTYRDLFQELIYSRQTFEPHLKDALHQLGLQLIYTRNQNPVAARLGIKILNDSGQAKITSMLPSSDSAQAGLHLGDKIIAVNGFVLQHDFEHWINHFKDDDLDVIVNRQGKIVVIHLPRTDKTCFDQVQIEPVETNNPVIENIFRQWSS